MMDGLATPIRSAGAFAPPTIPQVVALGACAVVIGAGGAADAAADGFAAFAFERCAAPIVAGDLPDVDGLSETTAEALGLTPEPIGDALPVYFIDEALGAYVGTLDIYSFQACVAAPASGADGDLDADVFEAWAAERGLILPDSCRGVPGRSDEGAAEQTTVAFVPERSAAGRWVQVAHIVEVESGRARLMAWEAADRSGGPICGEAQ